MPTYRIPFRKVVWGTFEGEANSKQEALQNYTDWDEFDNKSDYEVDENKIEELS